MGGPFIMRKRWRVAAWWMLGLLRLYIPTDVADRGHSSSCIQPRSLLLGLALVLDRTGLHLGDCHCCINGGGTGERVEEDSKYRMCPKVLGWSRPDNVGGGVEVQWRKEGLEGQWLFLLFFFTQYSYKQPIFKITETMKTASSALNKKSMGIFFRLFPITYAFYNDDLFESLKYGWGVG